MNILILNPILFTPNNNIIPKIKSIKDTMIYNMCLGFKQLGHHVTLAAAEDYKPIEEENYDFEVLFFRSDYKKIFLPSVLPFSMDLYRYIKRNQNRFDLVISSEIFAFPSLFASVICPKKALIWQELTQHQNKFHKLPSKLWHNFVLPLFMNKINSIVPRSEQAYKFISKYHKKTSGIIVDHGINISKFGLTDKKTRTFICVSQLIYRKNIDGIIEKFYQFIQLDGYKDFILYIAGRGEEYDKLQEKIRQLHLTGKVVILGFLSHEKLSKYVRESMAFLVNTRKDLNMVSIPESIVSGTPIVTNLIPSSATYIRKNKLGIAKKEWGALDLKEIVDNNSIYVNNCIQYRHLLTNEYSAQKLMDIYLGH